MSEVSARISNRLAKRITSKKRSANHSFGKTADTAVNARTNARQEHCRPVKAGVRRYVVWFMDCPTCGLANPPEAVRCDCGYDFGAGKLTDFPGWEINLAWRQMVAAFWSISWPAWIGSLVLVILFTRGYSVELLQDKFSVIALGGNLAFFAIQFLLTRRLVRKNYRSFRFYVIRGDGSQSRNLSMWEAAPLWLLIFLPQLALLVLASLVVGLWGTKLEPEAGRGISSLSLWLRLLVVAPYAVGFALRRKYATFRLQAHGFRYV